MTISWEPDRLLFMEIQNDSILSLADWEQKFIAHFQSHPTEDGSHDISHFRRVWGLAQQILSLEGTANRSVVLAASYFHDIVSLPKDHPERTTASLMASQKASEALDSMGFPREDIPAVAHAIHAHSFSARVEPQTLEAKIVQDADRIEALGRIGFARCFYVSGRLNRPLFHPEDPLAKHRDLDDQTYALDHFQIKLLKLKDTMKTQGGVAIASKRSRIVEDFMNDLAKEVLGEDEPTVAD